MNDFDIDKNGANKTIISNALEDFKRSVEITRDVRFQANLRLSRRQRGSSYIVSFLSLYVIAISLLQNIIDLSRSQNQILLGCSIVLSVFVIFTSLIDGSQNFFHQGELLHTCARKVATIHLKLKNIDVSKDDFFVKKDLEELQEHYQKALDECPVNHDNVDYYKEMANKPYLFKNYYKYKDKYNYLLIQYNKIKSLFLGSYWMIFPSIAVIVISIVIYITILREGVAYIK